MFGSIIPAPFAWAERVTPPRLSVQRLDQRSVVVIASEKTSPPAVERPAAASSMPGSTASIGSGTPIVPVSATATLSVSRSSASRRPLAHAEGVGIALLAGLGVGVAAVDDGGADVAAIDPLAADPDRRRGGGVAGQQQGRDDPGLVADDEADVGLAAALEAAVGAAGAEAGREPGGVELLDPGGSLDPARAEERFAGRAHTSPSVSSRPSIRLRFWIPWPEAPFQRLSIAEKASTRPRSSTVT